MYKDSYGEICKYFCIDTVENLTRFRQEKCDNTYCGSNNFLCHDWLFCIFICYFMRILYMFSLLPRYDDE